MEKKSFILNVGESEAGQRLDKFLTSKLPELSRARIQAILAAGVITQSTFAVSVPGIDGDTSLSCCFDETNESFSIFGEVARTSRSTAAAHTRTARGILWLIRTPL